MSTTFAFEDTGGCCLPGALNLDVAELSLRSGVTSTESEPAVSPVPPFLEAGPSTGSKATALASKLFVPFLWWTV